jgi:hypothetical protein
LKLKNLAAGIRGGTGGNGKDARRQKADPNEGRDAGPVAVDDKMIGDAVRQDIAAIRAMSTKKIAPENVPRESTSPAQDAARLQP